MRSVDGNMDSDDPVGWGGKKKNELLLAGRGKNGKKQ